MKYKWLLLDADGTLFDFDRAEASALETTFAQAGQAFHAGLAALFQQINKQMWTAFEQGRITPAALRVERFAQLFAAAQIELDPSAFGEQYLHNLAQCSELIDGAQEVIEALYGRVGLVIVTNGLAAVQRQRFARSAIRDRFADWIISEEIGAAKPDARFFEITFARIGHPRKDDVLIVGDSPTSDMRGGRDYGIDTCWFNPAGRPRPAELAIRYEITNLSELLPIVECSAGRSACP